MMTESLDRVLAHYDLEKDPNELRSVYDDPAYASVRSDLEAELERLREQYAVPEDARPLEAQ